MTSNEEAIDTLVSYGFTYFENGWVKLKNGYPDPIHQKWVVEEGGDPASGFIRFDLVNGKWEQTQHSANSDETPNWLYSAEEIKHIYSEAMKAGV